MKKLKGRIVSQKMSKTVVVEFNKVRIHPIYKKRIKRTKRIAAHSDKQHAVGDVVTIIETRPLSKNKHYRVLEVTK